MRCARPSPISTKTWFNIIDFTGSANARFADPEFDGFPDEIHAIELDAQGNAVGEPRIERHDEPHAAETTTDPPDTPADPPIPDDGTTAAPTDRPPPPPARKYYVDGATVRIQGHVVYELDAEGRQLRVIQYTDYTADQIRTLFRDPESLTAEWADPVRREDLLLRLEAIGIRFADLAEAAGAPDADPLDLLCHLAFQRPLRTRRERTLHLRRHRPDFFDQYSTAARGILDLLLDQYTAHGPNEFRIGQAIKNAPLAAHGNLMEIADLFGGPLAMHQALNQLQTLLYQD